MHKDKVLLFLDDTGKQFKQSTYIQSLSYVCLSVSFAWTGGGNCVYDREDMHLFSTGTEPLLQYDAYKIQQVTQLASAQEGKCRVQDY